MEQEILLKNYLIKYERFILKLLVTNKDNLKSFNITCSLSSEQTREYKEAKIRRRDSCVQ